MSFVFAISEYLHLRKIIYLLPRNWWRTVTSVRPFAFVIDICVANPGGLSMSPTPGTNKGGAMVV